VVSSNYGRDKYLKSIEIEPEAPQEISPQKQHQLVVK
jgi:hypothetical protein